MTKMFALFLLVMIIDMKTVVYKVKKYIQTYLSLNWDYHHMSAEAVDVM